MSIFEEYYNFTVPTTATMQSSTYFPLSTPMKKLNSLEFDTFNDSAVVSNLWNFGDPFSSDNEVTSGSVLDIVPHTYTYAGNYEINCLSSIDGTIKHVTKQFIIPPDTNDRVIVSKPEGTYTIFVYTDFIFGVDLYCYDHKAEIYYAIGATATDYSLYTGTITASDDFVLKYYAVFENGTTTETFTKTYVLERNQYSLQISPQQSAQIATFNMTLFSVPPVAGNPDFKIYYTTTENPTPTLYTSSVSITASTRVEAWIVHTYLGTDYEYDHVIKNYTITPP